LRLFSQPSGLQAPAQRKRGRGSLFSQHPAQASRRGGTGIGAPRVRSPRPSPLA
jgi:hypothetical protein